MIDKIEEKLGALAKLQIIDSTLDRIHTLRGSLPEEVSDLEDDVDGLESRAAKIEEDVKNLEAEVSKRKITMKEFREIVLAWKELVKVIKNR